ncbi:hypothetical protein MTO96_029287 [Rhipicephalus appendiculatus]
MPSTKVVYNLGSDEIDQNGHLDLLKEMEHSYCTILVAFAFLVSGLVAEDENDAPDAFRIFNEFPTEAKQGEYTWVLKNEQGKPKKKITFYLSEGSSPDKFTYKVGSEDADPEEATFKYTDYVHCSVLEMPFHGHQCILWSSETSKDSLPQECMEKFTNICGVGIPLYKKDLCARRMNRATNNYTIT